MQVMEIYKARIKLSDHLNKCLVLDASNNALSFWDPFVMMEL